jgi:hypothetical protein
VHLVAKLAPRNDDLLVAIARADCRVLRNPVDGLLESDGEVLREQLACRTATRLTLCGRRFHLSPPRKPADVAGETYRLEPTRGEGGLSA